MVAIKGMEMPNACTSTQESLGDIEVANCPLYNVCKHRDTIRTNYKPSDCPLVEIVTCKDCKYWDKETEYCEHWSDIMGRTEDAYYTVHTGADFYCGDAKGENK